LILCLSAGIFAAPTAGVAECAIPPGIFEQAEELENFDFIGIRMPFRSSFLKQTRSDRIISSGYLLLSWR
jgi:hypothetical protein